MERVVDDIDFVTTPAYYMDWVEGGALVANPPWDDDTKTIYLRKRLPVTRRRYILAHELGHAWLDWQHRHLDNGKAKT